MAKDRQIAIGEYVETILKQIGSKLSAKRMDEFGLLGDKVELSVEEDLAYEYVMLKAPHSTRVNVFNRYWDVKDDKHKGINPASYLQNWGDLLDDLDGYLTDKGYGYVNASNVDRYGLPKKLSYGRYMVNGVDLVYEDQEYGDLYTITRGALDLQRYSTIRVVKGLGLYKAMAENVESMNLTKETGITEVYLLGSFGVGLLVKVDTSKYADILDVFMDIEQVLDEELGFDKVNELLQQDLVLEFK